jgi:hypothetical protein
MLKQDTQCYTINNSSASADRPARNIMTQIILIVANHATAAVLAVLAFHLSLVTTSLPPAPYEKPAIERAISILEDKGFEKEVFLLRNTVTFRGTDHWLNSLVEKESAYASTNFPFQIVTLYNDFYTKTTDDTERAMVLLHEARHLVGDNENQAYSYVWKNRHRLGWTLRTHGTTVSYVTIEEQTREHAPELFNCPDRPWLDCTE